jgi:hypothetical protein
MKFIRRAPVFLSQFRERFRWIPNFKLTNSNLIFIRVSHNKEHSDVSNVLNHVVHGIGEKKAWDQGEWQAAFQNKSDFSKRSSECKLLLV